MTNAEYRKWLIEEILKMQTKNQFVKEGYNFVGWKYKDTVYKDLASVLNLTTTDKEHIVLRAETTGVSSQ